MSNNRLVEGLNLRIKRLEREIEVVENEINEQDLDNLSKKEITGIIDNLNSIQKRLGSLINLLSKKIIEIESKEKEQ